MIRSFADKETEKIFNQLFSKRIPSGVSKIALRKLMMIDAAMTLADLKAPPANRLEPLKGDRAGQWSIRINDQWRIVFTPISGGSDYENVEIVDYHR
ncbi:MAG: type II toxin-antitoxin system RelE/ParE family toxin [Bacilli bacterium]|nr:type II toxin-antitoxin system RelE/ParE family toxin [Bacilli bacterium]